MIRHFGSSGIENQLQGLDIGGNAGAMLNIYTGINEPAAKEGVWVKTDKSLTGVSITNASLYTSMAWDDSGETAIPYVARSHAAVVVGTDIYVLGGNVTAPKNQNYKYDTLSNTWSVKTVIPYATGSHTAVVVGTDIYVMGGGGSPYNKNYKYDTLTDTWSVKAVIPYGASGHTAVAVGTDIYVLNGYVGSNANVHYKYDTLTNTWTALVAPAFYGSMHTAVGIGENIYVTGGTGTAGEPYLNSRYNINNETWETMQPIPSSSSGHKATAVGTNIYILGDTGGTWKQDYVYNTLTNTWSVLPVASCTNAEHSAVTVGLDIYVMGGFNYPYTQNRRLSSVLSSQTSGNVILCMREKSNNFKAEIITPAKKPTGTLLRFLTGFDFAYFSDGGVTTILPTFIGTGTAWKKIIN